MQSMPPERHNKIQEKGIPSIANTYCISLNLSCTLSRLLLVRYMALANRALAVCSASVTESELRCPYSMALETGIRS